MNPILIPLLQGAGVVALAVMAFALAFTWPSLGRPAGRIRVERTRLLAFAGIGAALILAAAAVYLSPAVLLGDDLGLIVAAPIALTWAIAAAALVVRGMLQHGIARVISVAFAVVAVTGAAAGILSALCAHHAGAASIVSTGAFPLVVTAIAGVVFWSGAEGRPARTA
jgi:hypothetical protein